MVKFLASLTFILFSFIAIGQEVVTVEGYTYESGNRGYIDGVMVTLEDMDGNILGTTFSDKEGYFKIQTAPKEKYNLQASKYSYNDRSLRVNGDRVNDKDEIFLKLEMLRSPGYDFEITLAEARDEEGTPVDGILGARIDVYNNTKEEEVFVLDDYMEPEFSVHLEKENHYTMLIRKDGYIAKRIEAYVNVNGCILCVEGLGDISSGVADNLTGNNQMGVLLANVELEKIRVGKKLEVQNIYYDFGSARLTKSARENLNVLVTMMSDTPELLVELGSHTDARGGNDANMKLSEARAQSAVKYIRDGGIEAYRIGARGYGENILKNNCGDGMQCSEEEHSENRRTELKIVGRSQRKERMKSLAQMKKDEKAEAMLEEFQFGGQVSIPEGMSIKDLSDSEVERLINEVKAEEKQKIEAEAAVTEMEADQVESQIEQVVENETEALRDKAEPVVEHAVVVEKQIATEDKAVVEENFLEDGTREAAQTVSTNEMDAMKKKAAIEEQMSAARDELKETESKTEELAAIPVYKVVILEREESLPEDSNLYTKHSDLIEYIDEDNSFKYLIGNYASIAKANQFLKGSVKLAYPEAYVVKFAEGKILSASYIIKN